MSASCPQGPEQESDDPASASASASESQSASESAASNVLPDGSGRRASRPKLDTLVEYLLASKRSLSSTALVWRANELVTSARAALEESVALGARTSFLRRAINEQYNVLRKIKSGVDDVARDGQLEFEAVLRALDAADARLQQTLDTLRYTIIEAAIRPPEENGKTLHDFVEEEGVESIKAGLRESIDNTQEAQNDYAESIDAFETDLKAIKSGLDLKSGASLTPDDFDSPIPPMLISLESHAKEMADGLESLVRHFDLCVTAIKYTEGGGAAARELADDIPGNLDISGRAAAVVDAPPPEPISEEEHAEMLQVLEKDATELEDVVEEIRTRLEEMESQADHVFEHVHRLADVYADTNASYNLLEQIGQRLPGYLLQSRDFAVRWEEQKQKIEERMIDLEGMREIYENFLRAYDALLIEVGRRRAVQVKMQAIVRSAMVKIDQLHDDDVVKREAFRHEEGQFLPEDIWSGLMSPPIRFEVAAVNREDASVPELPSKVLEQAIKRATGRL